MTNATSRTAIELFFGLQATVVSGSEDASNRASTVCDFGAQFLLELLELLLNGRDGLLRTSDVLRLLHGAAHASCRRCGAPER